MRIERHLVLLVGTLAFSALPCLCLAGVHDDSNRSAFRREAEAKAAKAASRRLQQTADDLNAAIGLFQKSAHLFMMGGMPGKAADDYLQIGEIYFMLSQYENSLSAYHQALRLAGSDQDRRCRALSHMARTYATIGKDSEAASYSKRALNLSEGLSNPRTQAEALEARGEALYTSDSLLAVEPLSRARDLFAEAKDDDGQALALLMLADTRFDAGERGEATRLARQALGLWSANGNGYGVAQAHAALGLFSIPAGQFETARCHSDQALRVFQRISDKDNAAIVLNTLGQASMQMGDAEKSLEYLRGARASFAGAHDRPGEAAAIKEMGVALAALQRYDRLLPLFLEELHLGQEAEDPVMVAAALANMGSVYELKGQYLKAETLYRRSLAAYRSAHHPIGEGHIFIRLAHLYTEEEKYSLAISFLERARPLKEKTGQVEELARIDYELAYVYRRLGRLEDALQAVQRTIDIIESQRLKMAAFDSRASYFASVHKYYALYIQLLMRLHHEDPQLHSTVKALEASEKSKVRSLLDWLAGSQQDVPCDELLKRQLEVADALPAPAADSTAVLASETSAALGLDHIQAEIAGDDAVLLEYALGDEKSYLWVVNKEQISSHELPAAKKLNDLVQGFRDAVTARQARIGESNIQYLGRLRQADRDYHRYVGELSRLLLGPVPLGTAKRIIIVPDGPLQYVPFAALPVPADRDGSAILAADHEIIVMPSASALGALRKAVERRPRPTSAAAVFADPVFERDDPRVSQRSPGLAPGKQTELSSTARKVWRDVQPGSKRIPRLRASHQEAVSVQGLAEKAFVAEGVMASRETILNHGLGSYGLIHFATHGLVDEKHPERSGLILSLVNKNGEPQDGYLKLSDIYGLKLSADLVVLSSCDSGLGKDLSSEGIIGLPRAFLRAGAKSVIATLWKVDDQATAELMTHFYERLRQGESRASALRNAQLELSRNEQWSHPYYWAAFVFQGDYR